MRRLPSILESNIKSSASVKGWEIYLFNPHTSQVSPAPEIDFDDSYTVFPPIEEYRGSLAVSRKFRHAEIVLSRPEKVFAFRQLSILPDHLHSRAGDFTHLPSGYRLVVLYFIPRPRTIEVHTPETAVVRDGIIYADGVLLPYDTFTEALSTLPAL